LITADSGDSDEPFPFVPAIPQLPNPPSPPVDLASHSPLSSTRFSKYHRRGLQEEADEQDGLDPTLSVMSPPLHDELQSYHQQHQHGISEDNQYIRHELQQQLEQNYRPDESVAITNSLGRRLYAGDNHHSAAPSDRQQPEETKEQQEPLIQVTDQQQQREWLAVEVHPRLQHALLDAYRQRREENLVHLYSQHQLRGTSMPPQVQAFLIEQATALDTLKQQASTTYRPMNEYQRQQWKDEFENHSFSSVAMGVWMGSRGASSTRSSGGATIPSDEAVVGHEPNVIPPPLQEEQEDGDSLELDSRFSDNDYMTDVQWKALHSAMQAGTGSVNEKWQAALKASSNLPSRPVSLPHGRRRTPEQSRYVQPERSNPRHPRTTTAAAPPNTTTTTTINSGESSAMTETGIRTYFVCSCCFKRKSTRDSGWACDSLQSPHLMCSECTRRYLWSSLTAASSSSSAQMTGPTICRVPCFAGTMSSNQSCGCHVHIALHRLMEPSEFERWKEQHSRQQEHRNPGVSTTRRQASRGVSMERAQEHMQLAMKEALTNIKVRTCPTCQQEFVKDEDGCNKMKCTMCGATQCYICRKPVSSRGYDHFDNSVRDHGHKNTNINSCPLWTDKAADRERDLEEMRQLLFGMANQVWEESLRNVGGGEDLDGMSHDSMTSSLAAILAIVGD
jgi:hypothetical protein